MEDTAAYTYKNDRNAAELCQRLTGVSTGEAKRAIDDRLVEHHLALLDPPPPKNLGLEPRPA